MVKLSYLISLLSICCLFTLACGQQVKSISAADNRLPSEAKERIADAEDAVLIAKSRLQDAQSTHRTAELNSDKFSRNPPKFGAATSIAKQLISARLNMASLERS